MRSLRISAFLAVLAAAVGAAQAFTLEPITATLTPSGQGSVATFRVKGDPSARVAIRFSVVSRDMDDEGKELNSSADGLFVIFPARVVVEANSQAAVKVQWKGPARIDGERCFRFIAEQVPLDAGSAGAGIKIMFKYVASLYVSGPKDAPKIVTKVTGALVDGEPGYLVEVANQGSRHVVLSGPSLQIEGQTAPVDAEALGELANANYLPGRGRKAFIKADGAIEGRSYPSVLSFESVF